MPEKRIVKLRNGDILKHQKNLQSLSAIRPGEQKSMDLLLWMYTFRFIKNYNDFRTLANLIADQHGLYAYDLDGKNTLRYSDDSASVMYVQFYETQPY